MRAVTQPTPASTRLVTLALAIPTVIQCQLCLRPARSTRRWSSLPFSSSSSISNPSAQFSVSAHIAVLTRRAYHPHFRHVSCIRDAAWTFRLLIYLSVFSSVCSCRGQRWVSPVFFVNRLVMRLHQSVFTLFSEAGSLIEPGAHRFGWTGSFHGTACLCIPGTGIAYLYHCIRLGI